jgi:hypothetical protein
LTRAVVAVSIGAPQRVHHLHETPAGIVAEREVAAGAVPCLRLFSLGAALGISLRLVCYVFEL